MKIIAIRGEKGSGKTTLIEFLIKHFKKKGMKVGAVKHAYHIPDVDREGKDSFRMRRVGADMVFLGWREGGVLFFSHSLPLQKVIPLFSGYDLVLVEGFCDCELPFVEIVEEEGEVGEKAIARIKRNEIKERWEGVARAIEDYQENIVEGDGIKMLDVSEKPETLREAIAVAFVSMSSQGWKSVKEGLLDKGNISDIIKAGVINGVKATSFLIPLCHPLNIDFIDVEVKYAPFMVIIKVKVKGVGRTGFEMEAMSGAVSGALSACDVLKRVTTDVRIERVELVEKKGGKSKYEFELPYRFGVITVSDRASRGERGDDSGEIIKKWIEEREGNVVFYKVIPDDSERIKDVVVNASRSENPPDIMIFTGGTGPGPKDLTVLTLESISDKKLEGVGELMRIYGMKKTLYSSLSSGGGYVYRGIILLALPGSPSGVKDALQILGYILSHAVKMVKGEGH